MRPAIGATGAARVCWTASERGLRAAAAAILDHHKDSIVQTAKAIGIDLNDAEVEEIV